MLKIGKEIYFSCINVNNRFVRTTIPVNSVTPPDVERPFAISAGVGLRSICLLDKSLFGARECNGSFTTLGFLTGFCAGVG